MNKRIKLVSKTGKSLEYHINLDEIKKDCFKKAVELFKKRFGEEETVRIISVF